MKQSYIIAEISAITLAQNARMTAEGTYSFSLDLSEQANRVSYRETTQADCPIFHQALCVLKDRLGSRFHSLPEERKLFPYIVYVDFKGIYDRSRRGKNAVMQRIADDMFRPEGITLEFGQGEHRFFAFERSASMSRDCRLSFVSEEIYTELRERMMLGMTIGTCQLSKLYAYNGLLFTGGTRIESDTLFDPRRIILVDNPKTIVGDVPCITVEDDGSDNAMRTYHRVEKASDVEVLEFDGEGLVSPRLADRIDAVFSKSDIHSSYQIRMPYIKGVVHRVDFAELLQSLGVPELEDMFGVRHPVGEVDMILTKSQFKGIGWMRENGLSWAEYLERCRRFDHALYISGTDPTKREAFTELNYQFLSTIPIPAEAYRPKDLPDGWTQDPDSDKRNWITKETEAEYYRLVADPLSRVSYFTEGRDPGPGIPLQKEDRLARLLKINPKFLREPVFAKELTARSESVQKNYAIGHLLISGDNRYLSGDLMRFLYLLVKGSGEYAEAERILLSECLSGNEMYAPGALYPRQERYTLLRNPHIARNEETPVRDMDVIGPLRQQYLSHLTYTVMIDSRAMIADRLGGADFDGDMIKTIADPLLNKYVFAAYENGENKLLPLRIPAAEPILADAGDWRARLKTVKSTFDSRIGQISNAAFDRSVLAYNENVSAEEKDRFREETEMLAILSGLEIDSAKSGIKPDITEYFGDLKPQRSVFLRYKNIVEKGGSAKNGEGIAKRLERFFNSVDWSKVTSNIERQPHAAKLLKENTPKTEAEPASDAELFSFAKDEGWKERLDPVRLSEAKALIADYEEALNRVRICRHPSAKMPRKKDVYRILYARGQEEDISIEALYAAFALERPERIQAARAALRSSKWHFLPPDQREDFLWEYLGAFRFGEFIGLLCDFRCGGYRMLGDILSDYDDLYHSLEAEKYALHRQKDSQALQFMLGRDDSIRYHGDYKEIIAKNCRAWLTVDREIDRNEVLRCSIALGKRTFALEVLLQEVLENACEGGAV